MRRTRAGELVLVVALCGLGGLWWGRREPTIGAGGLTRLAYRSQPFVYSLQVGPDGSGEYEASLHCVMATPEPGELGCQHLNGRVPRQRVEELRSRLRQVHLEKLPAARDSEWERRLEVTYPGGSVSVSAGAEAAFGVLEHGHPGEIRKRLEAIRAKEKVALAK